MLLGNMGARLLNISTKNLSFKIHQNIRKTFKEMFCINYYQFRLFLKTYETKKLKKCTNILFLKKYGPHLKN